jgi:hypothetical protein
VSEGISVHRLALDNLWSRDTPPIAGSFLGRTRLIIVAPSNDSLLALCDDVLAVGHNSGFGG